MTSPTNNEEMAQSMADSTSSGKLLCLEGHELVTSDPANRYSDSLDNILCDVCDKLHIKTHFAPWTCRKCEFDFCLDCLQEQQEYSQQIHHLRDVLAKRNQLIKTEKDDEAESTGMDSVESKGNALSCFREFSSISDSLKVKSTFLYRSCTETFADHLFELGHPEEARILYQKALANYESHFGEGHSRGIRLQTKIAVMTVAIEDSHFPAGNKLFWEGRCLFQLEKIDLAWEEAIKAQNACENWESELCQDMFEKTLEESELLLRSILFLRSGKNESPSDAPRDINSNRLGVSVEYLRTTFMAEVIAAGYNKHSKISEIEDLSKKEVLGVIRRKGKAQISPIDGRPGSAYVHCLGGEDVGLANFMLSYSWSYSIGDIIQTLVLFCNAHGLDARRTYIWMCCMCINQHRVVEQADQEKSGMTDFEEVDFFSEFGNRVTSIGHVLAMLTPWDKPIYLSRIWCVYELYQAQKNKCELSVVMPPAQKEKLEQDLLVEGKGIEGLYSVLGRTRVQNAKASVERDRVTILAMIRESPGYTELNHVVNEFLRQWVKNSITQVVDNQPDTNDTLYADYCSKAGNLLMAHGELKEAMNLLRTALAINLTACGAQDVSTAASHDDIGRLLLSRGDYDGALREHSCAKAIYEKVFGPSHVRVAESHILKGIALTTKKRYDEALAEHKNALALYEEAVGPDSQEAASARSYIGRVLLLQNNYDAALEAHRLALSIRISTLGPHHAQTAESHSNLAKTLEAKMEVEKNANDRGHEEYDVVVEHHQHALSIQENMAGKSNYLEVAKTYRRIGRLMSRMGDGIGGTKMLRKAVEIQESLLGRKHVDTAHSYFNLGSVFANMGNYRAALKEYGKALDVYEDRLGSDHIQAKTCRQAYCNMLELSM